MEQKLKRHVDMSEDLVYERMKQVDQADIAADIVSHELSAAVNRFEDGRAVTSWCQLFEIVDRYDGTEGFHETFDDVVAAIRKDAEENRCRLILDMAMVNWHVILVDYPWFESV